MNCLTAQPSLPEQTVFTKFINQNQSICDLHGFDEENSSNQELVDVDFDDFFVKTTYVSW